MSGEKLVEGFLATTRNFRNPVELLEIAEEKRINTIAARERRALKQAEIDEQVEKGRELGGQRRRREAAQRREIHERVQAQNLQQRDDEPEPAQEVIVEDRLRQAAKSTRNLG